MQDLRDDMLAAVEEHAKGNIAIHKMNVEVYLANPAGIGEHSDITEAVVAEMEKIARYDDILEVIYKYFKD
jgi:septum formation topological specificity factor MinE|tara:strand:- start:285 stop:497 length:213 start_codon:yes stop_codon:yes gene_type:complete